MSTSKMCGLVLGLALAATAFLPAVKAAEAPPWRNQGEAIMIPPVAMQELLRCRHEQRPEDECFDRMVRAIDDSHRVATNQNRKVL